jgi:hypothetical protein
MEDGMDRSVAKSGARLMCGAPFYGERLAVATLTARSTISGDRRRPQSQPARRRPGWTLYLDRLVTVAEGGDPGQDPSLQGLE